MSSQGQRPPSKGGLPQVLGSKPPSRQGTAASGTPAPPRTSGTPRTGRSSGASAELGVLAQKLILRLRGKFGDAAGDVRGQEIISQEVLAFIKQGVSIKEEDLSTLECRIRRRLTGSTPVINTLAQDKKAQMEGDEWAKIFQYSIAEGKELDRQQWLAMKERQRMTRQELNAQMKEREDAKQAEEREAMEYAKQEQVALQAWEALEAERRRLQHDIAIKLKMEREEQLVEKTNRRSNAMARVRSEEEAMASRIAYETKTEFEKEEAQRLTAKHALREFLSKNDEHKLLKEAAKTAAWEEDAYFQQAWREVLDKQDRDRTERTQRNMLRQDKTAAYAASGALPEYKKWIDPAITQKHFEEREAKLERLAREKMEKAHASELAIAATLKEQMKEREMAKSTVRLQDEAKAQAVLKRAEAEEAREQQARHSRELAKLKFKMDLEKQMRENVARKRNQPISDVERSLNKELLAKVTGWKQTGRIEIGV